MITASELSTLTDPELFALMRRDLNSAVIGDILDQMGFRRQRSEERRVGKEC